MEALYWGCLFGGILFAVVSVLLGDVLSSAMDGVLDFCPLISSTRWSLQAESPYSAEQESCSHNIRIWRQVLM